MVQVVLGTDIYRWLMSQMDARGLQPPRIAEQIAEELRSRDGEELCVNNDLIRELAALVGPQAINGEQMDVGDCFAMSMARVANDSMNTYVSLGVLKMTNIAYCGRCKHASGKIETANSILLPVLNAKWDVKHELKDMLCNALACGYEFSPDIKCSHCTTPAEDSKLLNFQSLLEAPVFLPLMLQRVTPGTNVPMSTRVQIPPTLDLTCLIAGDGTSLEYEIFAWIKWSGWRVTSGHYTAYVCDGETTVRVFDDRNTHATDMNTILNDRLTQKGVKMLFYVRKECMTEENFINERLALSIEDCRDISLILLNERKMTGLIGRPDIISMLKGGVLNGQVLDACLQTLVSHDKKEILCWNSYLFKLLRNNKAENAVVGRAFRTTNFRTADMVLLPVFHPGSVGHYALFIIFPLTWMFHDRTIEHKINKIQERAL
eukprot:gene19323-21247_t